LPIKNFWKEYFYATFFPEALSAGIMRKTILFFAIALILQAKITAQKTEYFANINSGFFYFTGENSSAETGITLQPEIRPFIYNSPGRKSGISYEASLHGQYVARKKIIYGIELIYQSLQSKTNIVAASQFTYSSTILVVNGKLILSSSFIDIAPFMGYRLTNGKIIIDLKGGAEYAVCIDRKEKIDATIINSGQEIKKKHSVSNRVADLRIRFQLTTFYRRLGINAGYFLGLNNYYQKNAIGKPKAYANFFRLGLSYKIK
jgi:hypothetical protein